jgi:cytoskeletal protein CcmA (bactofilin family)
MLRNRRLRQFAIVLLVLSVGASVSARQFFQGDTCIIERDETIVGTLFVLCQDLTIDGTLDGNLIGAATNTIINGDVLDGVYLVGGQIDVNGSISDDLHFAGAVLNVHESASFGTDVSDIFSLSMSTQLDPNTDLPGSVIAVGYQMLLQGDVGGEVNFWGAALEINGSVTGDVTADVGDSEDSDGTAQLETLFIPLPVELDLVNPGLRVMESAEIRGLLRYSSPSQALIDGKVEGTIFFDEIPQQPQITDITNEETLRQEFQRYIGNSIREFATLAVVGAFGLLFAPGLTQAPIRNLRRRPLTSLGVGTLTFILSFPVVVIAVVISVLVIFTLTLVQAGNLTIAGIVVLLLLDVGGASLFYFVAIFVARSIVCLALGRRLLRFVFEDDGTMRFLYVSLAAGSLLVAMVVSLPFVGWLMNALTLFLGLGAIVNLVQRQLRSIREGTGVYEPNDAPPTGMRFGQRGTIEVEPPLLPSETPPVSNVPKPRPRHNVGTDDLPDGFVWWDEMDNK